MSFKVLPDGKPVPIGHRFVWCRMEFDIKMVNFRRKARLRTGGHIKLKYYSYLLCYVVDNLCIHQEADFMIEWLYKFFPFKHQQYRYVPGWEVMQDQLHDRVWAWAMSSTKYDLEAVKNCTVNSSSNYGGKFRVSRKAKNPFMMGYDPKVGYQSRVRSRCCVLLLNC